MMPRFHTFGSFVVGAACVAAIATVCGSDAAQISASDTLTITLVGQSMIRSDIREPAPAAVPVIQGLLKGDIVFTNFEAAIALPGEKVSEGRGFLSPPAALDALKAIGVNLLSLSGNHVSGKCERPGRGRTQ